MLRERIVQNIVPLASVLIIIFAGLYSLTATKVFIPLLEEQVGKEIEFTGVVVRDADVRDKTVHLTVLVESVGSVVVDEQVKILLYADSFDESRYGDRVSVVGVLKKPDAFETDSGRTFNYPKYLEAHGISYTILRPEVTLVEKDKGNVFVSKLLDVKHFFIRGIERALPEPESALLSGLLLGEKQSLGEKLTNAFRNAGVVHIIVLSGYNVALVIQWVSFVFVRLFSRNIAYILSAIFVIAFAIMTGASETTVRAVIMALFMMLATVLKRPKVALRGLCIAGALMAIVNPFVVLYDLSFQLSFLATLGLILFSGAIQKKITFVPDTKFFPFREIVATTIATQITVLPLLITSIGAISLVFLPANILVLPAVPVAMFVGFFASLVSILLPVVSLPLNLVAYGVLNYIIYVANFFGTLPFASIFIPQNKMSLVLLGVLGSYTIIALLVYRFRVRIFK